MAERRREDESLVPVDEVVDGSDFHYDVAQELNRLTVEEREAALHDLHGVSSTGPEDETPQIADNAVAEFRRLLEEERQLSSNSLLKLAEDQYPERMNHRSFHLMFLRATDFDAQKAVHKLLLHLEQQSELFGSSKVGKKIALADLSRDDIAALENGHLQLLREKDRSGRSVLFDSIQHRNSVDFVPDSLVRRR